MKYSPLSSLWLRDAKPRQQSRSTLVQVGLIACCLTATSHYLNQCWLLIDESLWHLCESNCHMSAQATHYNDVTMSIMAPEITSHSTVYSIFCLNWQKRKQTNTMTSSNGNIFRVTGPLAGDFPATDEFPSQRPVTRSCDVFFYLRLNKRSSEHSWGWWFETPSCPLCGHSN